MKRTQSILNSVIVCLFIFAIFITAKSAFGVEPGWYAPLDGSGQGVIIRCNADDECAANWLTYRSRSVSDLFPQFDSLITVVETSTDASLVIGAISDLRSLRHSEQIWLQTMNTCDGAQAICDSEFALTSGQWFGQNFVFSPAQVTAELEQTPDSLIIDYDARTLLPDRCDTGIGGLLLLDCIGVREFFLLAR